METGLTREEALKALQTYNHEPFHLQHALTVEAIMGWFAKEEGFDKIAFLFEEVGKIEKEHEERYQKLLNNLTQGKVFEREEPQMWVCANCGHIHYGNKAPEKCPVCDHPMAYFKIKAENY